MLCTRCLALRLCGHVAFYTPVAQPQKAYKNSSFLGSSDAQSIRILCELLETKQRLASAKVHHTILVRWPVALWRVDHRHPTRIFSPSFSARLDLAHQSSTPLKLKMPRTFLQQTQRTLQHLPSWLSWRSALGCLTFTTKLQSCQSD
mgnify:CR=1 FL=1